MPFGFCLWEGAYNGRGLSLGGWVLLIYGVINLVISVLQAGFLGIWVLHIKGTILPFGFVLFAGRGVITSPIWFCIWTRRLCVP